MAAEWHCVVQATHAYDTASRLTDRIYANGAGTNWAYDINSRVTGLAHVPPGGGAAFQEWAYPYTDEGNPLAQNDITGGQPNARGEAYGYDMMHRLITWKRGVVDPQTNGVAAPAVGQAWELDSVGNWDDWVKSAAGQPDVVEQREHSNLHALTGRLIDQGQPTVLAYDDNGNQTDDGEQFLFEYDANDKLQRVRNRGDNAVVAEYRYDVFGRRVQKEVLAGNPLNAPVGVTRYYYTGQRIAEERDGDDAVVAFYTYGNYIDEPLTMDRLDVAQPPPAVYVRHYFHHNRMFSTYALTDEQGAVAERYTYEAYGKVTTFDANYANPQDVSRVGNPWTYTGHFLEAETDLLHMLYRTYDPGQGRFKQTDPIGPSGGVNVYAYCESRATRLTDSRGLYGRDIHYEFTRDVAKMAGFADKHAEAIGNANQYIDDEYDAPKLGAAVILLEGMATNLVNRASPIIPVGPLARSRQAMLDAARRLRDDAEAIRQTIHEWHFPLDPGQRQVTEGSAAARKKVEDAIARCNLRDFGEGLHPFQDSYSHARNWYGPYRVPIHEWAWTWVDDPFRDKDKSRRMARETYAYMRKFLEECDCRGQRPGEPAHKAGQRKDYLRPGAPWPPNPWPENDSDPIRRYWMTEEEYREQQRSTELDRLRRERENNCPVRRFERAGGLPQ